MTEWTVVTVIIALVGLFFTVGKPILNLVKEMQGLRYDTDRQEKEINRDIESIKELCRSTRELSEVAKAHENRIMNQEDRMSEVTAEITELLKVSQSHEMRIHDLEQDVGEIKRK